MLTISRQLIADVLDAVGEAPDSTIRDEYTGRGYTKNAGFGLVLDVRPTTFFVQLAATVSSGIEDPFDREEAMNKIIDLEDNLREDSMGRSSTIIYFPGWTLED